MTSTQIVDHLAREFSGTPELVRNTLEMVDAGLSAPFIGRVRRAQTGGLSEGFVRRLVRRRTELEELDRRRATILRLLEGTPETGASEGALQTPRADHGTIERVRACMDRFELEDLFLPQRRPEPEVQLALDRGLARLADLLVEAVPHETRAPAGESSAASGDDADDGAEEHAPPAQHIEGSAVAAHDASDAHGASDPHGAETHGADEAREIPAADRAQDAELALAQEAEHAAAEEHASENGSPARHGGASIELEGDHEERPDESRAAAAANKAAEEALLHGQIELTPALARLCAPFVNPDRGVHTENDALAGAMRILSDRLGRDTRLRGTIRRLLRKQGVLTARPTVDEGRLGRHRPLLKVRQPLRQVQGHRLLAIRQAQKERAVTTVIALERSLALPKVRAALGKHTHPEFTSVLDAIALRTLEHRLLPLLEADVRLELKERADEEALRFLSQHLRQVLLAPPLGERPVAGIDINAKGDWTVAIVDAGGRLHGAPVRVEMRKPAPPRIKHEAPVAKESIEPAAPAELAATAPPESTVAEATAPEATVVEATPADATAVEPSAAPAEASAEASAPAPVETSAANETPRAEPAHREPARAESNEKDAATLGAELQAILATEGAPRAVAVAIGNGKVARAGVQRLRRALAAAGFELVVHVVNEAGLSVYASSEVARAEFAELSVPQRMAASLARRLQDPLSEIVKIDPRHLGLGAEQGLVSKANLKRMFDETIESCTALVGCDANRAPLSFVQRVPGLDLAVAKKLVERRGQRPLESREDLRTEGLLSEAQWTNAVAFLRVSGSREPLDATCLHPEQYDLARRVVESTGGSIEDVLGRPGATKGLRRNDLGIDEATWRDLMREIAFPGRDPRLHIFPPRLLDPETDRATLGRDKVVEGVISNVASFGAFVDLGLEHEGMVHVSEISDRYVRDARELVSVGQTIRARVLDGAGQRVALSLKHVPEPERAPRPERRPAPRDGFRDGPRDGDRDRPPRRGGRFDGPREGRDVPAAPVRAAQSRRDGLVAGTGGKRGGRGRGEGGGRGGGGGGGGGREPWKGKGRGDRGGPDENFRPEDLGPGAAKPAYNPFAKFFKGEKPAAEAK